MFEFLAERAPNDYGVTEIGRALGLTKATIHPQLKALVAKGKVRNEKGRYSAKLTSKELDEIATRRLLKPEESKRFRDPLLYILKGRPLPSDSSYSAEEAIRWMPNFLMHLVTGYEETYHLCLDCVRPIDRLNKLEALIEAQVRQEAKRVFGRALETEEGKVTGNDMSFQLWTFVREELDPRGGSRIRDDAMWVTPPGATGVWCCGVRVLDESRDSKEVKRFILKNADVHRASYEKVAEAFLPSKGGRGESAVSRKRNELNSSLSKLLKNFETGQLGGICDNCGTPDREDFKKVRKLDSLWETRRVTGMY